jgi:Fe-S-cluster containining protein
MSKMPTWSTWLPGDKNPGSVTTLMRSLRRAKRDGVSVPCGTCNACCRSPGLKVDLTPDEAKRFDHVIDDGLGRPILPKRDDGSCVHLVDGKCSVYADRPMACRTYDCRVYLLIGYAPNNDPVIEEALRRWAPLRMATVDDEVAHLAIRLAIMDGGLPTKIRDAVAKARRAPLYADKAMELRTRIKRITSRDGGISAADLAAKLKAEANA